MAFEKFRRSLSYFISPDKKLINKFNEAFSGLIGGGYTAYDNKADTYMEKGFLGNPDVYAVVKQMADKMASIPFMVKKVKDEGAKETRERILKAASYNLSIQQQIKSIQLEKKAFDEKVLPFPMKKPNELQTWELIWSLYKIFIRVTGNCYFYILSPKEGPNAGKPLQVYVLPAHQISIILKDNAEMIGTESPIKCYRLIEGNVYADFPAEDVIHVKYANPTYGQNGEHLYGLSPLKAGLGVLQTSNEAINLNNKTLKSGGAYGLIHSKGTPLTQDQADAIKKKLVEMDNSPDRLAKIAGVSAEIGFTRLSLTADELKPFEYLKYDQKQICNIFGWSDKLLNNDNGAKYDNVNQFRKWVVTDNIMPDLVLLSQAFNDHFLPRFKGYENTVLEFDISELPEMQEDFEKLSKWLYEGRDRGIFVPNEIRETLKWPRLEMPEMDMPVISMNMVSLEEALSKEDFNMPE